MTTDGPATATDLRVVQAENSPVLLADPTDPRFVVLAHRQDAPDFGCGLQVSGDGGSTWLPAAPVQVLPDGVDRCYAPEVVFDAKGVLYYLYVGLHGSGNNPAGVFLIHSSDRGRTFSAPHRLLGPGNYQVRMALDRTSGPLGRLHFVWLQVSEDAPLGGLPASSNPILSAYSDDGGATLSRPAQVSDPARQRVVAPALVLGPDHAVEVVYYDLLDDVRDYRGLEGPPWDGEWAIVATASTDGGDQFDSGVVVDEHVGPPGRVMLIYTMAPPSLVADDAGRLYVAWTDARLGDPDVFLSRSEDHGRLWSKPVRINDNAPNDGRDQYLPRLSMSPGGRLDVVYLDRRDDPDNVRYGVSYAYSSDPSMHFVPSVRLSTQPSDSRIGQQYLVPSAIGLIEFGSRVGLLSTDTTVVAAWPDNRNASFGTNEQNIFTAQVQFPSDQRWRHISVAAVAVLTLALGGVCLAVLRHRRAQQTTGYRGQMGRGGSAGVGTAAGDGSAGAET